MRGYQSDTPKYILEKKQSQNKWKKYFGAGQKSLGRSALPPQLEPVKPSYCEIEAWNRPALLTNDCRNAQAPILHKTYQSMREWKIATNFSTGHMGNIIVKEGWYH